MKLPAPGRYYVAFVDIMQLCSCHNQVIYYFFAVHLAVFQVKKKSKILWDLTCFVRI